MLKDKLPYERPLTNTSSFHTLAHRRKLYDVWFDIIIGDAKNWMTLAIGKRFAENALDKISVEGHHISCVNNFISEVKDRESECGKLRHYGKV